MPSELRPLDPPLLGRDAADVIREEILAGRLRRGEHLVEARLAKQLNISRGPIREAFQLLRAEGLVRDEPRRGTFVVTLSSRDVREIYELRAAVEGAAARLVAMSADPGALEELQSIIEQMSASMDRRDLTGIGRADLDFHEAICRLSDNRRLHAAFLSHVPAVRTLLKIDEHLYSSVQIVDSHRPILEAIERGDADLAEALCQAHCRQARDEMVGHVESLGDG